LRHHVAARIDINRANCRILLEESLDHFGFDFSAKPDFPSSLAGLLGMRHDDPGKDFTMNDQMASTEITALQPTALIFREDAYQNTAEANVLAVVNGMLVLDRTVFYAASGGQPADHGAIRRSDGATVAISDVRYLDPAKTRIGHALPEGALAEGWDGSKVTLTLDMARRMKLMRMHSALHLLSVVLPYPVTGGAVGVDDGRLDFDIPDAGLDREDIAARLNALISKNAAITDRLISEAELDANPGLVKTMSVQPPRGTGTVRLIEIAGLDLQPCGGTHVRNTREIGAMQVTSIEKKGKLNRRVRIAFA
jgi:misacylated tRNA(Ala) deacylase